MFRKLIFPVSELPPGKFYSCGSVAVDKTPESLYRLLYLCQPKNVDFSDMYKTRLWSFTSRDERFLVMVHLFKYELGLYFACPKECLTGKGSGVMGGWPGADNGVGCSDETGLDFFRLVVAMAKREQDVYPGNNFKV